MKNKNLRLLGLLTVMAAALTIGISSCKKDKDDNGSSAALSATIGGNAFKPRVVTGTSHNGYISVVGGQTLPGDSVFLDVTFPDTSKVNTKLNFDHADLQLATFTTSKLYSGNDSRSHGSVTVTTLDKTNKKVAGKFEGVIYNAFGGPDSVVIKDGQFNTTYKAF
ncbi:hypothetical protein FAM09_22300 [Niastella caeni]|uniref:Lipoprotein n=1 Tax=Niastella caeni TaxID=2569763 RepID=A0A4S8HP25_9BACT|nr:hypothetical protein [Niastella caeni]THU34732.1 hypothetical protein FAM09_22300 [Niastella caeni]